MNPFWFGVRRGFAWTTLCLLPAWLMLLGMACKVYLPMCQPSEDAPVGVTVHRVVEDDDAGAP